MGPHFAYLYFYAKGGVLSMPLLDTVAAAVRRERLIPDGAAVLIALSVTFWRMKLLPEPISSRCGQKLWRFTEAAGSSWLSGGRKWE